MKHFIPIIILFIGIILACAGTGERWSSPLVHEQEDGIALQYCLECHDTDDEEFPYRRYVHTAYFSDNHRRVAKQSQRICAMCHQLSFCNDCHGTGIELKPSIKNQTRPDRRMPHMGDYLSRHRIDGRLDPVSCRRCHGNPRAARTCRRCHG